MSDGRWQLEGSAAELYQRYLVPGITTKWADDLVHRAQLRAGEDVLDVACGTGVVTRLAARKVTPGHVTGLDLNSGMLAVARNVSNGGELISWKEGSALDLPFPSGHFDVVLCQLGLQFFPDQPKALREMRRVVARRRLRPWLAGGFAGEVGAGIDDGGPAHTGELGDGARCRVRVGLPRVRERLAEASPTQ
jgi:SAM-dependent methyltransferase